MFLGDPEVGKNQDDDEDVIDREGVFDQIAGDEFEGFLAAVDVVDDGSENERQRHPDTGPGGSLLDGDFVGSLVEDAEVDGQNGQNPGVEGDQNCSAHVSQAGAVGDGPQTSASAALQRVPYIEQDLEIELLPAICEVERRHL